MSISDRLAAALADRYRIERPLGAGGMATVYLAADLKHDRRVAIKVLKPELAAVLGAERFVQEIKTTAALSHPHILPLFDSGEADGFLYYVMPYIEGETIRDRLNRENQLGVDEAVRITCEIADALDYAHRHGVIHRDIKPENLLLHDGRAMVMDFGIALAVSAAAGGRMTETGLSLGTPHYMSPEQATADRDISARSDIYSLASVCYEMLAGDPPHTASSAQAIIMKIVTEEAPSVTTRRKSVPHHVADALATALEKLPADRFETAKMFADALRNPAFAGTTVRAVSSRSAPNSWRAQAAVPLATASALLLVLAAWGWMRPGASGSGAAQNPLWLALEPPQGRFSDYPGPTLSPDGTRVAFFAPNAEGVVQLWVRDLSSTAAQPVLGTDIVEVDVAQQPFWSADGKSVAFFAQLALYRTELDGRAPIRLADAPNPRGGSWSTDDVILFVPATGGLHQVNANGGPATPLSNIDAPAGTIDRWPHFLPDGRHFLFLRRTPGALPGVFVGSLDEPEVRPVLTVSSRAEYANGNLYYVREGTLFAQPFDLKALTISGTATRVADGVGVGGADFRNVAFSAAAGHVVTWDGVWARLTQPTVIGPDGKVRRTVGQPGAYLGFALERGGTRIAIERGDLRTSIPSIWLADVVTGQFTVFATPPEGAGTPQWLPGARELIYSTFTGNTIVRHSLTSADTASIVVPTAWISDVTPDGKSALISTTGEGTGLDIFLVPLDGNAAPRPYLNSPTSETGAVVSPDGTWIAYNSNASGVMEVYVQSFPIPGNRQLVSDGGGEHPQWSADGRMLYYLRSNSELVAATVTRTGSALAFSRRTLFRVPTAELQTGVRKPFVPLGDGSFLFNLKHDAETPNTMRIGLNWAGR